MELQFHGISLSVDQKVNLRRKPSIMKAAVVTAAHILILKMAEKALGLQKRAPSFGADVRFGSKADLPGYWLDVRSSANSGH
jgi:hypothetical protein